MAVNYKTRVKDVNAGHDFTLTLTDVYRVHCKFCVDCKRKTVKGLHPQKPYSATIEHIKPLSEGGLHHIDNVVLLCHSCNSKRNQLKQLSIKTYKFSMFGYTVIIRKD